MLGNLWHTGFDARSMSKPVHLWAGFVIHGRSH